MRISDPEVHTGDKTFKILLVDDQALMVKLYYIILNGYFHTKEVEMLTGAGVEKQAQHFVKYDDFLPDLAILDIDLDGKSHDPRGNFDAISGVTLGKGILRRKPDSYNLS